MIEMKKRIKIRVLALVAVLMMPGFFSCDEWLELIPPEGLIREEFWKTKEEVEAVLMGAYESFSKLDGKLFRYGEMRADLVVGDRSVGTSDRKIIEGNIHPENYLCEWSEFYQIINYCNEVIKNAPAVQEIDNTFTDFHLQGFVSEAKFLRGLNYFYLVRIFKDVPLVLDPNESDDSDFYLPKTDGDQILEYLLTELEQARQFATTNGYQTPEEIKGRATKAAFDALLADISLWLFKYEECIRHVERIEFTEDFELMPSAHWFELFYPGNSLESIYEFQFNTSYNQNNSMYGLTRRWAYNYDPSQTALELFGREYTNEIYRGEDSSIKKYGDDDFVIWKYVGRAPDGTTVRATFEQSSCNWIVYRYADVLLMKAEALSQIGRYSEALEIINQIRTRADVLLLDLPDSPVAYEDAILEERALEFAFEGKRWFDLLRMGRRNNYARKNKLIEIIVKNIPASQKRILAVKLTNPLGWYMPVHELELERNKNLVQNPYYDF